MCIFQDIFYVVIWSVYFKGGQVKIILKWAKCSGELMLIWNNYVDSQENITVILEN